VRRLLIALALTVGMLVLTPTPSWACSCAAVKTPEQVHNAGTVAAGTIDWTATDGQTRTYQVSLDAVYKGAAAETEKLATGVDDASCGLGDLATGKRYLFFIDGRHPGAMRIGLCGGTTPYDAAIARQVERVTGPPGKPSPSAGTADVAQGSAGRTVLIGAGAAGLLALAALVAFALRRRA
jgi:hypothetical protein